MSSPVEGLAGRREALIARSDRERAALAATLGGFEKVIAVAELGVAAARGIQRHRVLVGVATAGLVLAPLAARTWMRRAIWWLPIAIEGYRLARSLGGTRREPPPPAA
jgi:hypothetical protein